MPMDAPGSLSPDQVYALSACILGKGRIVGEDAVMDAASLPKVEMPNAPEMVLRRHPGPPMRSMSRSSAAIGTGRFPAGAEAGRNRVFPGNRLRWPLPDRGFRPGMRASGSPAHHRDQRPVRRHAVENRVPHLEEAPEDISQAHEIRPAVGVDRELSHLAVGTVLVAICLDETTLGVDDLSRKVAVEELADGRKPALVAGIEGLTVAEAGEAARDECGVKRGAAEVQVAGRLREFSAKTDGFGGEIVEIDGCLRLHHIGIPLSGPPQ